MLHRQATREDLAKVECVIGMMARARRIIEGLIEVEGVEANWAEVTKAMNVLDEAVEDLAASVEMALEENRHA